MTTTTPPEPDYRELLNQLRMRTAANRFAAAQRRQLQQIRQQVERQMRQES